MVREITYQKIFSIRKVKNQKKWNKEEDKLLLDLAQKYNERNWKEISLYFHKKNPLQCFSRYKRIRPGIHKGAWTKEEDQQIMQLVKKYGTSWSRISKEMQSRNGKQIRDRYINVLDPYINKDKFTIEEDATESTPTIIDDGTTESTTEEINDTPDTGYNGGTEAKHSDIFKVETDDDYLNDITKDGVNNSSDYVYLYNTNMSDVYILERRCLDNKIRTEQID